MKLGIIGIGTVGNRIINKIKDEEFHLADCILISDNNDDCVNSNAERIIKLDVNLNDGLTLDESCKSIVLLEADKISEISKIAKNYDAVFIVTGMGGKTSTAISCIVGEELAEKSISTIAVVTKPFEFEGKKRVEKAEQGITKLKEQNVSLLAMSNGDLFNLFPNDFSLSNAFGKVDDVLVETVKSIAEMIESQGLDSCDLKEPNALVKKSGCKYAKIFN